jgi:hypothetical protein
MTCIQKIFTIITIFIHTFVSTSNECSLQKENPSSHLVYQQKRKRKLNEISRQIGNPDPKIQLQIILDPKKLQVLTNPIDSHNNIHPRYYRDLSHLPENSPEKSAALAAFLFAVSWDLCNHQENCDDKIYYYATTKIQSRWRSFAAQKKYTTLIIEHYNKKFEEAEIARKKYEYQQSLIAYKAFQEEQQRKQLTELEERKAHQKADNKARDEEKKRADEKRKKDNTKKVKKAKSKAPATSTTKKDSHQFTTIAYDDDLDFLDQEIAKNQKETTQPEIDDISICLSDIEIIDDQDLFPSDPKKIARLEFHRLRNQRIEENDQTIKSLEKEFIAKLLKKKDISRTQRQEKITDYRKNLLNAFGFPSPLDKLMFEQLLICKDLLVDIDHIQEYHIDSLKSLVVDWHKINLNLQTVEKINIEWMFESYPENLTPIQKYYRKLQSKAEPLIILYDKKNQLETGSLLFESITPQEITKALEIINRKIMQNLMLEELNKLNFICNNIFQTPEEATSLTIKNP